MNSARSFAAVVLAAAVLASGFTFGAEQEGWVKLFDGKTLEGWEQRNGTATYKVEDGAVVGRTAEGSPNSFLCTTKEYGDFELEFEVKVDDGLNSGVQIRSKTAGDRRGRVNGPQVEIETGRAEAGYVYGEATGLGWLTPESELIPHEHLKSGQWNKYRVVAKGPRIQTWINGEPIADLTHDQVYGTHPKGFIALQVHSIKEGTGPYEVRWRNIRLRELGQQNDGLMLAHMVYFELTDDSAAARQKLIDACKEYLSDHPGTVAFAAGVVADEFDRDVNDRDWDVSLHLVFRDKAAHDRYAVAPSHLQFIEENRANWKRVRVFDSYLKASGERRRDQ
jgi:hypothetical protein